MPEARDDLIRLGVRQWATHDGRDVEVAAARLVTAQRPRTARVNAYELTAENFTEPLHQLGEVRALLLHEGILSEMLYLFDGYNILHAGDFRAREELIDRLASFVAVRGARGVVVFDGVGEDAVYGDLEVRFTPEADSLIERLAAEQREREDVWVISSDRAIRGTAGQETRRLSSKSFLRDLDENAKRTHGGRSQIEDALDEKTRSALERFRRRRH